ncbi:hypothetical protein ACIBCT_22890 [Streptosporangium sp. NPDC050855]
MLEDYRAGLTVDLRHEEADRAGLDPPSGASLIVGSAVHQALPLA